MAYISGATEVGTVTAPIMASFSSQGPNTITPEILKVVFSFFYVNELIVPWSIFFSFHSYWKTKLQQVSTVGV